MDSKEETLEIVKGRFYYQTKRNHSMKVHEELFKMGLKMSLDDWKAIRTSKYWELIDKFPTDLARKQFTYTWIKNNQ